jgi:hypothetical protein
VCGSLLCADSFGTIAPANIAPVPATMPNMPDIF